MKGTKKAKRLRQRQLQKAKQVVLEERLKLLEIQILDIQEEAQDLRAEVQRRDFRLWKAVLNRLKEETIRQMIVREEIRLERQKNGLKEPLIKKKAEAMGSLKERIQTTLKDDLKKTPLPTMDEIDNLTMADLMKGTTP